MAALAEYGIEARSRCEEGIDYTGVWVEDRKIASIGVHVSKGVSTHGFAVNVTNDLDALLVDRPVRPARRAMTSVERELGRAPGVASTLSPSASRSCFCEAHGRRERMVPATSIALRHPRAQTLVSA